MCATVACASRSTLASCLSRGLRTPMPSTRNGLLMACSPATSPACVPALPVAWTSRSTRSPISFACASSSIATAA